MYEISMYALLLYTTISQKKPAGFQALIRYVPISKSSGYELAGSVHWNNCTCIFQFLKSSSLVVFMSSVAETFMMPLVWVSTTPHG